MANAGPPDDDNLKILLFFPSNYWPIASRNKAIKHLFMLLSPDNVLRKLFSDAGH